MKRLLVSAMSLIVTLFLSVSFADLSERPSQIHGAGYFNGADASFKTSDSTAKCGKRARMSMKASATLRCAESSEAAARFVPWRARNETAAVVNGDGETVLMAIADTWHEGILWETSEKLRFGRDFPWLRGNSRSLETG